MIKESVSVDNKLVFQCFHQGELDEPQERTRTPMGIDGIFVFWIDSANQQFIAKNKDSLMTLKLENI